VPKLPSTNQVMGGLKKFLIMGNSPQFRFIKILSSAFAPVGGFITMAFVIVYLYEWGVYLAGVEKMDIFESIPIQYKLVGFAIGLMLLVLSYVKKYYEATKDDDKAKFDTAFIISMICSLSVGALASYVVVYQIAGVYLSPVTEILPAIAYIAGLTAVTVFVIDRLLFHQMGDAMYLRKLKKQKNTPIGIVANIITTVKQNLKASGYKITDDKSLEKVVVDILVKDTVDKSPEKEAVTKPMGVGYVYKRK